MKNSRGLALRSQILLIVLGAAIAPLGVVGLWLTHSAVGSGEELLRSHLDQSADRFVAAAVRRWEFRESDITLVAGNAAAVRAVTRETLDAIDRAYLTELAGDLSRTIPSIELRDSSGRRRWSSTPESRAADARSNGNSVGAPLAAPAVVHIEKPIVDASGTTVGTAATDVSVAAIVPPDSARPLVPGAHLGVKNGATGAVVIPLDKGAAFPDAERLTIAGETWLATHRRIERLAMDFVIAAPVTSYVAPFERAGVIGVTALLVVAGFSVLIAILLATRATRPLAELARASDAIAHGNLDEHVVVGGPAEVRRVGGAFNLMTENLRSTLDELSRRSALAAVGEFATSLSHDVRNALTSIHVDLDRLSMRDLGDPVAKGLVGRALNGVTRLETSVAGALRVARRGRTPATTIDLSAVLLAAVDLVRGTMAAIPAELDVRLPTSPLTVRGDAAALQQLFANLLFNAAQSLEPGGRVQIDAAEADGGVDVIIADDGVGISRENLARMERPFFSTKANGTGLGLPIARQIAAAHAGSLSIDSEPGRGTTVRVRLPAETNRSPRLNEPVHESAGIA
jgi:signal transduction histidine kinase